ncbi:hypothetical protein L3Q82_008364 [Scortum barcoo]|uniref:Uncharacterized protein n=1 Tax=Scortum barcoo TaxID=214431 RepID=A0ACB8WHY0_9TELE|nr:hypothetical protein L3Q82_008364 [Scortum barcoo]
MSVLTVRPSCQPPPPTRSSSSSADTNLRNCTESGGALMEARTFVLLLVLMTVSSLGSTFSGFVRGRAVLKGSWSGDINQQQAAVFNESSDQVRDYLMNTEKHFAAKEPNRVGGDQSNTERRVTGQTKSGSQAHHGKERKTRTITSPGLALPGPHPGARPGVGARRRVPGGLGLCPRDPAGLSPKWRRGPTFQ